MKTVTRLAFVCVFLFMAFACTSIPIVRKDYTPQQFKVVHDELNNQGYLVARADQKPFRGNVAAFNDCKVIGYFEEDSDTYWAHVTVRGGKHFFCPATATPSTNGSLCEMPQMYGTMCYEAEQPSARKTELAPNMGDSMEAKCIGRDAKQYVCDADRVYSGSDISTFKGYHVIEFMKGTDGKTVAHVADSCQHYFCSVCEEEPSPTQCKLPHIRTVGCCLASPVRK